MSSSSNILLGNTFSCIIAKQFNRLKFGDRFFYENTPDSSSGTLVTAFTFEQLKEIKKATMSGLICNNYSLNKIQPNAFYTSDLDEYIYIILNYIFLNKILILQNKI